MKRILPKRHCNTLSDLAEMISRETSLAMGVLSGGEYITFLRAAIVILLPVILAFVLHCSLAQRSQRMGRNAAELAPGIDRDPLPA